MDGIYGTKSHTFTDKKIFNIEAKIVTIQYFFTSCIFMRLMFYEPLNASMSIFTKRELVPQKPVFYIKKSS
jgi:hypothetical protein